MTSLRKRKARTTPRPAVLRELRPTQIQRYTAILLDLIGIAMDIRTAAARQKLIAEIEALRHHRAESQGQRAMQLLSIAVATAQLDEGNEGYEDFMRGMNYWLVNHCFGMAGKNIVGFQSLLAQQQLQQETFAELVVREAKLADGPTSG